MHGANLHTFGLHTLLYIHLWQYKVTTLRLGLGLGSGLLSSHHYPVIIITITSMHAEEGCKI